MVTIPGDMPLRALQMPVSAVLEEVKPVLVQALANGDHVYTFPKNFVGTIRVKALPNAAHNSSLSILSGEWLSDAPPAPPAPKGPVRCGEVQEKEVLTLGGCPKGKVISAIEFASFGTPTGSCKTGFKVNPACNAKKSRSYVTSLCVNKRSCKVTASKHAFGGDPCADTRKKLAVQIKCETAGGSEGDNEDNVVVASHQVQSLPPLPPAGNGTFPAISGRKPQFENHVLRAGNTADLETLFCWHGFQYVRVSSTGNTGFRGGLNDIVGLAINTNLTATGALEFGGDGVGSASDKAAAVLNGAL